MLNKSNDDDDVDGEDDDPSKHRMLFEIDSKLMLKMHILIEYYLSNHSHYQQQQ